MGRYKKAMKFLTNEIKTMDKGAYEFVLGQIFFAYKNGIITEAEERDLNAYLRAKRDSFNKEQYPEWA